MGWTGCLGETPLAVVKSKLTAAVTAELTVIPIDDVVTAALGTLLVIHHDTSSLCPHPVQT